MEQFKQNYPFPKIWRTSLWNHLALPISLLIGAVISFKLNQKSFSCPRVWPLPYYPMIQISGTLPPQPFPHPKGGVQWGTFSMDVGSLNAMLVDSVKVWNPKYQWERFRNIVCYDPFFILDIGYLFFIRPPAAPFLIISSEVCKYNSI